MTTKTRDDGLSGWLDLLVLSVLSRGSLSGLHLLQAFDGMSRGHLTVSHGSVYPVLEKLEKAGYLEAESTNKYGNRPYRITQAGKEAMLQRAIEWDLFAAAVTAVVHPESGPSPMLSTPPGMAPEAPVPGAPAAGTDPTTPAFSGGGAPRPPAPGA